MNRLLDPQFYFHLRPDPNFQFTKITVALIILFFAISIAVQVYRKKYAKDPIVKKILKKYPGKLRLFAIILLLLLIFREAGLPFLSMRIWWFALLIYVIFWAVSILRSFKKDYENRLKKAKFKLSKDKYLPRKKKK